MIKFIATAVLALTSAAPAVADSNSATDATALGTVIGTKEVVCWPHGGSKDDVVFTAKVANGQIAVTGPFAGVENLSQVIQVSTGGTLLIQASGPDLDEGEVVLLLGAYYLSGDGANGPTDAEAVVYDEIGPGDGSGTLQKITCELR